MEYFWSEQTELPAGIGYPLFGPAHLAVLALILTAVIATVLVFRRSTDETRRRIFRGTAVLLPVLEVMKILFLTRTGHMGIGYLPLHLCSMSIYLYPVIAFTKNKLRSAFLSEVSVCTLLPAALFALLFPDWTMYPMCSFMNIYAYLWHTLQVLFPLFCILQGTAMLHIRHLWWNTVFLLVTGIPVYLFDLKFNCNYWFLLWPVPGTPLVPMSELFDGRGYRQVLLLAATAVNLCVYGLHALLKSKKHKPA